MAKVNVYDKNGDAIGRVEYSTNLDVWDGSNWTAGSTGRHLGITKLKNPADGKQFVLIYGTQWQGEQDRAELVSDSEARQAVLKSGRNDLLEKYFPSEKVDLEEV